MVELSDRSNPVRVNLRQDGSQVHAFNDRLNIDVTSQWYDHDWSRFVYPRSGQRLPVEIGGISTSPVEVPGEDDNGQQTVGIPVTVPSGQQPVTVDGKRVGTVIVNNPDMPLPEPDPESDNSTTPEPNESSNGSGASNSGSDNSDPAPSTPSNSPTPDPSGSTDSGSTGGGSSIDSRTRAAVIAVMGVVAALIAAR